MRCLKKRQKKKLTGHHVESECFAPHLCVCVVQLVELADLEEQQHVQVAALQLLIIS
jgi:hypothetical protein